MTSTLTDLLAVFDVTRVEPGRYTGGSDAGVRDVIDASQYLAQAIVAASAHVPGKVVRKASGVFCRPVRSNIPIDFTVNDVHAGRLFTTLIVTVGQGGRTCGTITVLMDVPSPDVIRHPDVAPASSPENAIPNEMPLPGRELRLVGLADPNDPDEVSEPRIEAWLHYDPVPDRDDLRRALLAHFTGHLSISATMRGHAGIGTAMSHHTVSTAVMAIDITFHEPVSWDGWILYDHDSTAVDSGMSYVRGQIRDQGGRLLASFAQNGMIRGFETDSTATNLEARARL